MTSIPAALIAHDLKNALSTLEGELASLAATPDAEHARSAYQRCVDLRRQFVQFLMVYGSQDALRAHCEDESPQEVLSSVSRSGSSRVQRLPNAPRIVMAESSDVPPYWYFDLRLVQLALDAALHNACRFGRQQITLSAREDSGYLVFVIDDDGPGLGSPDSCDTSTGLGTELCRSVAQAHRSGAKQGRIELFNRAQGGTRFELWLP
ncbi:MAG TPA: HAMP domain-containing sensor histidine kinase [Aquabacterium sp.]|nr:HAMP domain-containing sensor histidine kinase [Aquabacterium sp.]